MTSRNEDHGVMNLVASDLFFGLGAVLLVAVAALSLSVQQVVSRAVADRSAAAEDTRVAVAVLAATTGPILLADAQGLHRLTADRADLIEPDDLWSAPELAAWLAASPLLVIAPTGQDVAFLTYSRAAGEGLAALPTLRLTKDCRALRQTAQGFACSP